MKHFFILLFISCTTLIIKDPHLVLNDFELTGLGKGRLTIKTKTVSFNFESYYQDNDLMLLVTIPFYKEFLIKITSNDIFYPDDLKLDPESKELLIKFIDLIRTKNYSCKENDCIYENIPFALKGTKKGTQFSSKNINALILDKNITITTDSLTLRLNFR